MSQGPYDHSRGVERDLSTRSVWRVLAPDSPGRAGAARSHALRPAPPRDTAFGNSLGDAARPTRMHMHVVHPERDNTIVTLETAAELMNGHALPLAPVPDAEAIALPATGWLPAVSTNPKTLDDPHGWYQQTLVAELHAATHVKVIHLATANLSAEERQQTSDFTRHTLQRSVDRVRPFSLPADTYSWATPTWSTMVRADERVVTHVGILYRVIQVGPLRVTVGGIGGVMTLSEWRGRGYARAALSGATAFVGKQLWAPFALVICPDADVAFYEHLGWSVAEGQVHCEQPGGRVTLPHERAVFLPCQGAADWPSGSIDLLGLPW